MAIFDKNKKRIRSLEKKDPVANADRIKELRKRGPEWHVRYWDSQGKAHEEICPSEYQTEKLADNYYQIVTGRVKDKTHSPRSNQVSMQQLIDFFLAARLKKAKKTGKLGGYRSAKSLCNYYSKHLGDKSINHLLKNPEVLIDLFDNFPEEGWAPKYIWNYYKELRAIFSLWIKRHLLPIPNPMDAVECPDPEIKVMDVVPTQADYERIIATCKQYSVDPEVIRLIGAVRYSGLRINEVLGWQVADVVLYPTDNGIPYFWTEISKQSRKTRVPRPMARELFDIIKLQIGDRVDGPVWRWENPPYKHLQVWTYDNILCKDGKLHLVKKSKQTIYKLAGVNVPRPFHDFRKTIKMELKRMKGLDPKIAQAFQGHKTASMDEYYTHWQREDMESAVRDSWEEK